MFLLFGCFLSFHVPQSVATDALWSAKGRFEPRLNLDSTKIIVIVNFEIWIPGFTLSHPILSSTSVSGDHVGSFSKLQLPATRKSVEHKKSNCYRSSSFGLEWCKALFLQREIAFQGASAQNCTG